MSTNLRTVITGGSVGSQVDPDDLVDYINDDGDIIRMHHQRRSTFAQLPVEIATRIGTYLTTPDLGALRLTCKQVESSLFREFAREFFSTKQFMVTYDSLEVLLQISQHKNLGPRLKRLIIGLDCYYQHERRPFQNGHGALMYMTGHGLQQSLLNDGDARDLLAQAISNLSGLQTIEIRDQNSNKRHRDGGEWHSYGWRKVEEETGIRLPMNMEPDLASHIFNLTVGAIAKADRQVPNIEILLKNKSAGLMDRAFIIPPPRSKDFSKALGGLKKLHLDINIQASVMFRDLAAGNECVFLKQFLTHTKSLTVLRFNFQSSERRVCHYFLDWMIQTQMYKKGPGLFPNLEQLQLGFLSVDGDIVNKLLKAFPQLSEIGFYRVTLVDSQLPSSRRNLWAQLMNQMAQRSGLKKVAFGLVQQGRSHQPGQSYEMPNRVGFLKPAVDGTKSTNGAVDSDNANSDASSKSQHPFMTFQGDRVAASLKALAKSTVVNWPREKDEEEKSNPDDDDDDDDDGDEDSDSVDD